MPLGEVPLLEPNLGVSGGTVTAVVLPEEAATTGGGKGELLKKVEAVVVPFDTATCKGLLTGRMIGVDGTLTPSPVALDNACTVDKGIFSPTVDTGALFVAAAGVIRVMADVLLFPRVGATMDGIEELFDGNEAGSDVVADAAGGSRELEFPSVVGTAVVGADKSFGTGREVEFMSAVASFDCVGISLPRLN